MSKSKLLLGLVLLLATLLRVVNLQNMPASLNWDEVSHGYNAYSILKTGTDEWGNLPIANFRAYGDYPLPLNLYLTMPSIMTFGLTSFAIRFPHAVLGVLTVLTSYYLAYGLTKKKNIALLVSFLVAIDPWHVFTSRFVLQSNLSVFFLTAAMAAFFNRSKYKVLLPLSVFLLGLTLFSYHTTRIFTPLLVIAVFGLYRRHVLTKATVVLFVLFFLPLPLILSNPEARARSSEVFILNDGAIAQIENARNTSTLPIVVTKLVYNRPVYLAVESVKNYAGYFSPQFLFLSGGTQYQFSLPGHGLLYIVSLPFFYIGVAWSFWQAIFKKNKDYRLISLWYILAPLPASITTERFAVLRASTMLPLPEIFTALGFFWALKYISHSKYKKIFVTLFIGVSLLLLGRYLDTYFGKYKTEYSWAWQHGYEETVSFAKDHYSNYDKIIVTKKYGEPHEFFLFYSQWSPADYKSDLNLNRFNQSRWWWVDGFDKFVFVNDWQIPKDGYSFITESKKTVDCDSLKCLLITSPQNAPIHWRHLKTIYFLDKSPAFEIYENK